MKVLIISHNPITSYQSMGKTMQSLFSEFEKNELCQLYIYPTMPDIDMCSSYFRMTDRDVLASFFCFGKVKSKIITHKDIDPTKHSIYDSEEDAAFYKKNKKNSATLICRDIMWSVSHWYHSALKQWLDEENPTCIFLAPGESKFIYNIALKIAKKRKISIFTYICDDYYFVNPPEKMIDRLQLCLLKRKMKRTLTASKGIITICEELAKAYRNEFGRETRTILTGTNYPIAENSTEFCEIQGLTYMGNLSCNRFIPIAEIGNALDRMNAKNGTAYRLFLYTTPLKESTRKLFSTIHSIIYCGYVTGENFEKILHSPTILLHVEAFDTKSVDRVKHSVSTKIADCLGSGNLLMAYGPDQVASVQHLIRNGCAVVVTNADDLDDTLETIWQRNDNEAVVEKAIATAKEYHSSSTNSLILRSIFSNKE